MLEKYFRPALAGKKPFSLPDPAGKTRLHLNESPYTLPPEVKAELQEAMGLDLEFNRYGDPYAGELRREVARYAGVNPEQVFLSNGSDELIYLLHLAFVGPGRRMALPVPSFPSYQIYGQFCGSELAPLELGPDFSLPVEGLLREANVENTSLLAVCNPNNPTGNLFPREELLRLVREGDCLVLVDEAYYEYSGQTLAPYLEEYPNLLVMRTLSKAFSAAGVRIGYLLAHPEVIGELGKVALPFNLGLFPQIAGQILLKHREHFLALVEKISRERERVAGELGRLPGVKVYPSATNFLLVSVPTDSSAVWQALYDEGILVTDSGKNPRLTNCLRLGIGTPEENDALIAALKRILG